MTDRSVVWIDSETTGLGPDRRIWEFAAIKGALERVWVVTDVDLEAADPKSLEFGGFYDRHPSRAEHTPAVLYLPEIEVAYTVQGFLQDCTVVAAIPEFDLVPLAAMLRRHGLEPSWHYRTRCIESMATGTLGMDPGGVQDCARVLGIDVSAFAVHTALGDARLVRECWRRIMPGGTEASSVAALQERGHEQPPQHREWTRPARLSD